MERFHSSLAQLKAQGRYRTLRPAAGVDLTSNDYLGMAAHPSLKDAAIRYLEQADNGIGAGGSRLLRGHTQAHAALEHFAAQHFKAQGALYFSSGFLANYALLTTLPQRGDIVFYDSLVHASMREGLHASSAKGYKFAHNDLNALESLLKRYADQAQKVWIAVESLYSMDGDLAPIADLYALAQRYNAILIVDEAHATGIYGAHGKGLCYEIIQQHGYERLITLHTCGKAIGVAGALVCAQADIIDVLINTARPFIYSTAPMPLQAHLVQTSLEILSSADGDARRATLLMLCDTAQSLLGGHGTPIVPIILGEDRKAVTAAQHLQDSGYDIRAIRPPTVPENTARLRLSVSLHIDTHVLEECAKLLKDLD